MRVHRKDGEYPLEDGLGSERTVTNSSQTVTGSINFDAFGNKVGSTGSSTDPYMFAQSSAYRSDGDAGLMHVGARYYDAQVGRFITRDTVLTQKPYQYCDADPVNAVDPSGHHGGAYVPPRYRQREDTNPILPPWARGAVMGGIVTGGVVIIGAILFPPSIIIDIGVGAAAGAAGGVAAVGYGNTDPEGPTFGQLGEGAGAGAVGGAFGGVAGIGKVLRGVPAPPP